MTPVQKRASSLRVERAELGITQVQLRELCGASLDTIRRAEHGQGTSPETIARLRKALRSPEAKEMVKHKPLTRAEIMRRIPRGEYHDFPYGTDNEAAAIRGNAYKVEGSGAFKCERVPGGLIRVWRIRA